MDQRALDSLHSLQPKNRNERLWVSVSDTNGEPFALHDKNGQLQGGLAHDIMSHVGKQLKLTPTYWNLPRARIEYWLSNDLIDAACFLAPDWVSLPDGMQWSPPLFQVHQVIVSPLSSPAPDKPEALFGKRLGVLLNYVYPELHVYFREQKILRADAPSARANLSKLQHGRIDAYLDVDIAALYMLKKSDLSTELRITPLWSPPNDVHCAFSHGFSTRHPQWQRVLQDMISSKTVTNWIGKYVDTADTPPVKH